MKHIDYNIKYLTSEEGKNAFIKLTSESFYNQRLDEEIWRKVLWIKDKYKIKTWFSLIGYINDERSFVQDFTDESFLKALENLEDELKQF